MADEKESKPKIETAVRFGMPDAVAGARPIADDEASEPAPKEVRCRMLREGDEEMLDAFLAARADTHLFLRFNLRQGGLTDEGRTYQGTWVGAIEDDPATDTQRVLAAAAIFWNGRVLLQLPERASDVLDVLAAAAPRDFVEVSGPTAQVERSLMHLWLRDRPIVSRHDCSLMTLGAESFRAPDVLGSAGIDFRPPMGEELALLGDWHAAFREELWGVPRSEENDLDARQWVRRAHDLRQGMVVTVNDKPVAYAAATAKLDDWVNIGAVYVPPEMRGRDYAKCAVAGIVRDAQRDGVTHACLTAEKEMPASIGAYTAVGFQRAFDWTIVRYYGA
ncbi:MAG: GNAT family N-acetyltransferase [Alphaproteobacteria bacterium]|nr:GNAT family N-acetyltransferase [Alphaproteobacteria bacterium]MCW5743145.1 GNAT family N-acetyltransferase [Alphaproteobacteria bacterium]